MSSSINVNDPTANVGEPGAVLVRFEDGSGIVFGDGSDEETAEMEALLESQSCTPEAVTGIRSILLDQGLTLKAWVPEDGRAFSLDPPFRRLC
jgi:hypothetical protein